MRQTADTRRTHWTVAGVMVALFLLAAAATAGCGGGGSSTALPAPGSEAEADAKINETGTSRGGSRSSSTKSPSRTATTVRGSAHSPNSGDNGGGPSKTGDGATSGSGPGAGNPSVTNSDPNTNGPGTAGPTTKVTGGPNKRPAGNTTTTGGGRPYPGPSAEPPEAVVTQRPGPGGPVITPNDALVARYDRIYQALPARSSEVNQETEGVIRESPPAATGDAAILVAAAEEVNRTGNVAKYEEPQVKAAYQNMKAQQAQVPAGVAAGR